MWRERRQSKTNSSSKHSLTSLRRWVNPTAAIILGTHSSLKIIWQFITEVCRLRMYPSTDPQLFSISADVLRSPSCRCGQSADAELYAYLFPLYSTIWRTEIYYQLIAIIISLLSVTVVITFANVVAGCCINLHTLSPHLFCIADRTSLMDVTREQCSA